MATGTSTGKNINLKKVNGTATDSNSGNKSAGTLRVVLATDQPALTNKLLVTPDLPSGAATSAAQTDKSQFTKITDGTDTALVTAAGEQNVLATAQPGVDIGDVTINNASGGSAVNIQDGGNSITVDGTVAVSGTVTISGAVTNAGTFVVQENGAALTSLQLIDDTIATLGTTTYTEAATKGAIIGAVRRDANTTLVDTTNEVAPLQVNATGELKVAQIQALPAGTNLLGKVGIDQTTPGTTNLVALTAETTKVIGVTRTADGAGNLLTSNSTTYTAKFGLDGNLLGTLGTAFSTAGKVDVKGADGDVFVRQATASNLNMTEASAASILTSVQLIDDIVYTDDTSTHATGTSKGALMMAAATPTDTAVNANDIGALAMTVNRELLVQVNTALPAGTNAIGKLSSNSGVTIGAVEIAAAQTLATVTTLTGTTTLTPGTGAANLGKAEDAVAGTGDTGVFSLSVANEAQSTLAADGDYIARAADTKGNSIMVGNIAHDGVDAGNPVLNGYRAIAHGTNPTAVAAADRTVGYANRAGIPFVIGGHPNVVSLEAAYTAAQTDTAIVTIATGLKIVVTEVEAICDNANTVNVACRIGFGTVNTPTTTGVVLTHPGIAPGSGVIRGTGAGILGVGTDDQDLRITCGAPTTGSIRVLVSYYTIET